MESRSSRRRFNLREVTPKVNTLLVFALILGYYTLVFLISSRLAVFAWAVFDATTFNVATDLNLATLLAAAAVLLAIRLMVHLTLAVFYLVTARSEHQERLIDGVELDAFKNAKLYRLVDTIARRVGSPIPERIWIVPFPECFTVEIRHFGIRTRRRQLLALGYPLLQVMSLAELRVIVAHELAHLENDTRMVVLVYRFLDWLQKDSSAWWRFIDPACWMMVIYSRIFRVFAVPLLRSQEYQADRVSAKVCGSQMARRTLLKTWLIERQFDAALQAHAESGTDDESLYRDFAGSWRDFSDDAHDYLLERLSDEEESSWWDSHPTTTQRISRMTDEGFTDEGSATDEEQARELIPELNRLEAKLFTLIDG